MIFDSVTGMSHQKRLGREPAQQGQARTAEFRDFELCGTFLVGVIIAPCRACGSANARSRSGSPIQVDRVLVPADPRARVMTDQEKTEHQERTAEFQEPKLCA